MPALTSSRTSTRAGVRFHSESIVRLITCLSLPAGTPFFPSELSAHNGQRARNSKPRPDCGRTAPRTSGPTTHPPRLDRAIDTGSSSQNTLTNYCTISSTIPDSGGWLVESLGVLRCSVMRSAQSRDGRSRDFRPNLSRSRPEKPLPLPVRRLAQVQILGKLTVCGEVGREAEGGLLNGNLPLDQPRFSS
jgi:hypothetical protein